MEGRGISRAETKAKSERETVVRIEKRKANINWVGKQRYGKSRGRVYNKRLMIKISVRVAKL